LVIEIPAVVRNKARAAGADDWIGGLPALLVDLAAAWSIKIGKPFKDGSEHSWPKPPGVTGPSQS
jgi:streptomycin 6-kinase